MKKLTRLMNYKAKQKKNIRNYNPFDTGDNGGNDCHDGNDEMPQTKAKFQNKTKMKSTTTTRLEPKVHHNNYNNKNNKEPNDTIAHSTKTKAVDRNKFFKLNKKPKQQQLNATTIAMPSSSSSLSSSAAAIAARTKSRTVCMNGSVAGGGGNNNINYASLDRMRNSNCTSTQSFTVKRKRKWPYLWWKRYGRNRKLKTWRLKRHISYWRHLRQTLFCCCKHSSSHYQYNSDEDDDIDAKFKAYVFEMQRRDALEAEEEEKTKLAQYSKANSASNKTETNKPQQLPIISMTSQLEVDTNHATNNRIKAHSCNTTTPTQVIKLAFTTTNTTTTTATTSTSTTTTNNNRVSFAGITSRSDASTSNGNLTIQRRHSQYLPQSAEDSKTRRVWTWDDSLRSNSDRFLETLEENEDISEFVIVPESIINTASTSVNSSRCSVTRSRPSLQQLLASDNADKADNDEFDDFVVIHGGKEAKAAAEELSRSPVMGQRNDPTSSPIQSRGSGSSDNWPTQSDEDIDRLVAMHQNRSSLSSLGLRSDSMASVYSGAGEGRYGTVVVKGQVEFGMQYNYKLGALEIHVVRCKDLAAVDSKRNRSDPYVKVYLLPDKSKAGKRKTKVKKHTLNPIFDEVLRFHMPISNLESRTLWLTVWHSDMFGRNDFLGEVSVNLQGRVFDNPQSQWYLLQERSEPFDEVATYRGDIVVGLKYVTPEGSKSKFMRAASLATGGGLRKFGSIKSVASSKTDRTAKGGQLHVLVKEAKHLTPIKPSGSCDAFCKSYLLPDRTRSSKQKTPVVKRSTNPSWNYTFIYEDVSLEDLSERALELTVWDHDRLASNEFLGGVRFSLGTCKSYGSQVDWMDASGKELSLWQNMLDRPNFWVEGSVVLRSSLDGIRAFQ